MSEVSIIQATFVSSAEAERALRALRDRGFEPAQIEVLSSTPQHELTSYLHLRPSRAPRIALLGGIVGAMLGYLLAAWTARVWSLPTGGMPIVAPFTVGIIVFETTALIAILSTAVTLLYEGRLVRFSGHWVDTSVLERHPDGTIVIAVRCPNADQTNLATEVLQSKSGW